MISEIKSFLSKKHTGLFFTILAFAVKISMQIAFFDIDGDKAVQLWAAKNLSEGHGLTLSYVTLNDFSTVRFVPLIGWPPGYSVMISPLLWLFNGDYKLAALIFDIISICLFLYFLFRLLNYFSLLPWLKNLFILFSGFFFYPIGPSTCTDSISLSCMLAALYCYLLLAEKRLVSPKWIIAAVLSAFLSGFFRYNYVPVSLLFPCLFIIAGIFNKNKWWVRNGIYSGIFLFILISSLLLFQHFYTGSIAFVNSRETGLFPDNFLKMYPVVPASFIDIETCVSFFCNISNADFFKTVALVIYISAVFYFALVLYVFQWLLKNRMQITDRNDLYVYFASGISLAISGLLFWLSLRNSARISPFYNLWTYVQEYRYFVFIVIVLQLSVFIYLFNHYKQLNQFWRITALGCATLMTLGVVHKMIYTGKIITSSPPFYSLSVFKKEAGQIIDEFTKIKNQSPNQEVVFFFPDLNYAAYAGLQNLKTAVIPSPKDQLSFFEKAAPGKLVFLIPENMRDFYSPLLNLKNRVPEAVVEKKYIYVIDGGKNK